MRVTFLKKARSSKRLSAFRCDPGDWYLTETGTLLVYILSEGRALDFIVGADGQLEQPVEETIASHSLLYTPVNVELVVTQ